MDCGRGAGGMGLLQPETRLQSTPIVPFVIGMFDVLMRVGPCRGDLIEYFSEALASLQKQSIGPTGWNLWLGIEEHEGSVALKVARKWAKAGPNMKVQVIPQVPMGMGMAYAKLWHLGTAPWIVQFDADDVMDKRALRALGILAKQRPDVSILTTGCLLIDESSEHIADDGPLWFNQNDLATTMLHGNALRGLNAVRRSALVEHGAWNPDFQMAATYELYLRMLWKHKLIVARDDRLLFHRRLHPAQVTKAQVHEQKDWARKAKALHLDTSDPWLRDSRPGPT